jgi:hypothetical protein
MGRANDTHSVVHKYLQHRRVIGSVVLGVLAFPRNPSGNPTLPAVPLDCARPKWGQIGLCHAYVAPSFVVE